MFTLLELRQTADLVHRHMPATPQYAWPLLAQRLGCTVWVKHENHSPVGAFKLRGGLAYMDALASTVPAGQPLVTATRGNHGQSIAVASQMAGFPLTIVVPEGNSSEKNAAMRAQGATVVIKGRDVDDASQEANRLAQEEGLLRVPSFHPDLVRGVATYALELFEQAAPLDTVYVPIGMGSGICGLIRTRDLLGLETEIVGVVAEGADAYAQSMECGEIRTTETADTIADGIACRKPDPVAFDMIRRGAARVIRVSDDEITAAMRLYHEATHNLAEGAGAAALAGLLHERERQQGRCVGVILSGGNLDREEYARVLMQG
ncbi:threonine dehydratase [Zymobacter sp. IVIA_5232.4 C2]|uniref:threonine dehydratase n=1 Tax=Zymobacter sp. IVIA_5232.4 C2 TaxID=3394855 RepID=UPI0039C15D8B